MRETDYRYMKVEMIRKSKDYSYHTRLNLTYFFKERKVEGQAIFMVLQSYQLTSEITDH